MKTISIVIPTYNEEGNVEPLSKVIIDEFENHLPEYDYEIIFIDNDSNIRLLKSNITTDIDYLATDEKFVYYTDSKEKKIFSYLPMDLRTVHLLVLHLLHILYQLRHMMILS